MTKVISKEKIARVCHEANRAWCAAIGDTTQKSWEDAADWQRDSAVKGVEYRMENRDADPSEQHEAWKDDKVKAGWVYGEVKDEVAKTHPCIIGYDDLPIDQRMKDYIFGSIVLGFITAADNGDIEIV